MTYLIDKQMELEVPVARVWQALTDYREFGDWFRVALSGPFKPGQVIRGHVTYPGYEHMTFDATVKEMQREELFSYTWHPYPADPQKDYSKETPTLVEFRLQKTANGTLVSVTESGFDKLPSNRRAEAFRMNDEGWVTQLKNLEEHFSHAMHGA